MLILICGWAAQKRGSRGSSVRLGQLDEAGNRAVDGGPVEAGVRVVGAEVGADDLAALELSSL